MTDPESAPVDVGWQPLPARALTLAQWTHALSGLVFGLGAAIAAMALFPTPWRYAAAIVALVALPMLGVWFARKQHRHTRWRLDATGFGLRKGRFWHSDIRVPRSRVQHVDLRHGPLERRFRLATLVLHTAGTRHSAVEAWGLDRDDAERLRDLLACQIDRDDDAR